MQVIKSGKTLVVVETTVLDKDNKNVEKVVSTMIVSDSKQIIDG